MIKFKMRYADLKALVVCRGNNARKTNLTGVCFFVKPSGEVTAWCTNEEVMACHKIAAPANPTNGETKRIWLSGFEVERLTKHKLSADSEITIFADKQWVKVSHAGDLLIQQGRCPHSENSYPYCPHYITKLTQNCTRDLFMSVAAVFPFSALNLVDKMARILKSKLWQVRHYGRQSIGVVRLREDFWVLLTQIAESAKEEHQDFPEWMTQE